MHPAIWILIGVGVLAAILVPIMIKQVGKDKARLTAWAKEHGWQHETGEQAETALARSWFIPDDRQVYRPWTMQVLRRQWNARTAMSFMYGYQVTQSNEPQFHVIALALPVTLPMVTLARKPAGARIYRTKPGTDITFEAAVFNRTWQVHGSNRRFVSDFLHPRMMERLLHEDVPEKDTEVFVTGNQIFTMRPGRTDLGRIDATLSLLSDLVDLIPDHVLRTYSTAP